MGISKPLIVEASFQILSENGLNGLSMRKIANKLQISAPSLYFHVKDKQELYSLIAEHISNAILTRVSHEDTLQAICAVVREEYYSINDSPQIFIITAPTSERRVELINLFFEKLRELGVSNEYLSVSGNLLNNYILSFVTDEQLWKNNELAPVPLFTLSQVVDYDDQFNYGLGVIIRGLANTDTTNIHFVKP
jgi:Transcriptional regulator